MSGAISDRHKITLTVNDEIYTREVESRYLLADFLRHELGLTGTHIGCEHGVCGACTVLVEGRTTRSCLQFAVNLDGKHVTTIEGVADGSKLHPIQQAFHELHALQCGYCTPGFIMTSIELLQRNPHPTRKEIREALINNMCRCTGYLNIVNAIEKVATEQDSAIAVGEKAKV